MNNTLIQRDIEQLELRLQEMREEYKTASNAMKQLIAVAGKLKKDKLERLKRKINITEKLPLDNSIEV